MNRFRYIKINFEDETNSMTFFQQKNAKKEQTIFLPVILSEKIVVLFSHKSAIAVSGWSGYS
jgi:hypothetical protein